MEAVPLWGIFTIAAVAVVVSIRGGYLLGRHRGRSPEHEQEGPVGAVAGATLGLLAFLLAFTFGYAAERFGTRKQLVLDEAIAIGTAFLRAGLVAEPHRTEIRTLLRDYVSDRVAIPADPQSRRAAMVRAEDVHRRLWSPAVALARADLNSDIGALLVESLNQVMALHSQRVTVGLHYRIPPVVWFAISVITILSMGIIGYHLGLSGGSSWPLSVALAVTFATVVWMNVDLDRESEGTLQVSQQPMVDLERRLQSYAP